MLTIVKRAYTFTITDEPDEDFLKYLRRKLNVKQVSQPRRAVQTVRLDISLDDEEGDVVAGIAAMTCTDCLNIELLWVEKSLRGDGIGTQLVGIAEQIAAERGCTRARISTINGHDYFTRLSYVVTARLQSFPDGMVITIMEKALAAEAAQKDTA